MELNLTTEQKLQSLQNAEVTLSHEIYNTLLRVGVDPEVFEESDIEELRVPGFDGEILRLEKLLLSLSVVKQKLSTIS
jgi:hypothetical protein